MIRRDGDDIDRPAQCTVVRFCEGRDIGYDRVAFRRLLDEQRPMQRRGIRCRLHFVESGVQPREVDGQRTQPKQHGQRQHHQHQRGPPALASAHRLRGPRRDVVHRFPLI